MVFRFIIPALIHSIFLLFFSGGIIIYSTFLEFSSSTSFGFTILSAILVPVNSTVTSAALWTPFLEPAFRASNPVLAAIFNNCYPCLLNRILANGKNSYSSTFFLVLGSTQQHIIAIY